MDADGLTKASNETSNSSYIDAASDDLPARLFPSPLKNFEWSGVCCPGAS